MRYRLIGCRAGQMCPCGALAKGVSVLNRGAEIAIHGRSGFGSRHTLRLVTSAEGWSVTLRYRRKAARRTDPGFFPAGCEVWRSLFSSALFRCSGNSGNVRVSAGRMGVTGSGRQESGPFAILVSSRKPE